MNIKTIYYLVTLGAHLILLFWGLKGWLFSGGTDLKSTAILLTALVSGVYAIKQLPSNPLTYGIITFLGKRTPISVREGLQFIPIGFGLEPVEIRNINLNIPVNVVAKANQQTINLPGIVTVTIRPSIDCLSKIVDNGGYDGIGAILKGPVQIATNFQCNGRELDDLVTSTPIFSAFIRKHLEYITEDDDPNDDFRFAGAIIQSLQIKFIIPNEINEPRIRLIAFRKKTETFKLQQETIERLLDEHMKKNPEANRNKVRADIETNLKILTGQIKEIKVTSTGGSIPIIQ